MSNGWFLVHSAQHVTMEDRICSESMDMVTKRKKGQFGTHLAGFLRTQYLRYQAVRSVLNIQYSVRVFLFSDREGTGQAEGDL